MLPLIGRIDGQKPGSGLGFIACLMPSIAGATPSHELGDYPQIEGLAYKSWVCYPLGLAWPAAITLTTLRVC